MNIFLSVMIRASRLNMFRFLLCATSLSLAVSVTSSASLEAASQSDSSAEFSPPAAPASGSAAAGASPPSPPSLSSGVAGGAGGSEDDVLYDQRQNGTENVRIHMNDVTVVVAPSDGLLQLLGGSGSDLLHFGAAASHSGSNSHHLPTSEFSTNISGESGKPTGFDCDGFGKCRHAQQAAPSKK